MNYTVTGGAGFIGSHLARHLVSAGHRVTVIDSLSRGRLSNLGEAADRIDFAKLDILDHGAVRDALKDADGIFHQAALTSVRESYEREDEFRQVNIQGTENIFQIAGQLRVRVVYASSAAVYGDIQMVPVTEDARRDPINPYGQTKLEDELLAERYSGSGAQIIGLRYFNVYGRRQTADYAGVVTRFLERIRSGRPPLVFGDGSQARDFVFVEDVVRANIAAMTCDAKHGFFNIGTGNPTTIRDLARLMIGISGRQLEPEYGELPLGDARMSGADISKAGRLLGWRPETKLEEGLRTLFEHAG